MFASAAFPAIGQTRATTTAGDDSRMQAERIASSIVLDGVLDEEVWQQAAPISDFRQSEPIDGAPASRRTEVRVVYGDNAIYIGATLFDDEPALIERALGRRDDYNRADWFLVSIDAYFDHKTAYSFGVNAAGIQFDALLQSTDRGGAGGGQGGNNNRAIPRGMDPSWDAIWYSSARLSPEGWTAELRIPYSMLRFSDADRQTWGIHFIRRIPRLGEQAEWPYVPRIERDNLLARFARLEGIRDVNPRRNVQVSPYTVSRLQTEEHPEVPGTSTSSRSVDVGGDVKIGLGTNVTLDATINPDFGQVEADPAVLNLTAFETFLQERRPFFVEGIQIYEFAAGPGQLLYTRRIGADAPIIGATKVSGRTESGLSYGVLGAMTGDRFRADRTFGVGRIIQRIGTYSSAGAIVTAYDGADIDDGQHLRTFASGLDWDLRFRDNAYDVEGFFSVTNRSFLGSGLRLEDETGFAGKVWLRKRQGAWNGFGGLDVFSDTFNPNDLGQLRENNFVALISRIEHELNGGQPIGPFLRAFTRLVVNQRVSYESGLDLGQEFDFGSRWTLRNLQSIGLGLQYENPFSGYDLYESRGLLAWKKPASFGLRTSIRTDERRSWQLEPGLDLKTYRGGGREVELGLEGRWNVNPMLSLSGQMETAWGSAVPAWASNESFWRDGTTWRIGLESLAPDELADPQYVTMPDDGGALDALLAGATPYATDRYYVSIFGTRDTRSFDLTLRSTVTFTRNLSVQYYGQIFAARGTYDRFQLQQSRDVLLDYPAFPKRNEFGLNSFQSSLVFRWEYRPGSRLFLVWTHGRQGEDRLNPLAPWGASPYDRSIGNQFNDTFALFPQNVFLIKLNYTFLN